MKKARTKGAAKKKSPASRKTTATARSKAAKKPKAAPAKKTAKKSRPPARQTPVVTSADDLEGRSPAELAKAGLAGFDAGDLRKARRSLMRLVEVLSK